MLKGSGEGTQFGGESLLRLCGGIHEDYPDDRVYSPQAPGTFTPSLTNIILKMGVSQK